MLNAFQLNRYYHIPGFFILFKMNDVKVTEELGLYEYAGLSVIVLILSLGIFGIVGDLFKGNEIAAMTAFGTALTGFTSFLLVGIYFKQTKIFRRHGKILEKQTEIMRLNYIPDLSQKSSGSISGDNVRVSLSNIAEGYANEIRLTIQVEFDDCHTYSSPLTGHSSLLKTDTEGQQVGIDSLAPNESSEFEAPAILSIDEHQERNFEQVVDNLAAEGVTTLRVSIMAEAKNSAGDYVTDCPVLPNEHFYANLDDCDTYDLEAVYKCSSPSK